jgi:YD repeat-containing protein
VNTLDLADFHLNGPVKKFESRSYKPIIKDDSVILKKHTRGIGQNMIVTFDSCGNVIAEKKWHGISGFDKDTIIFKNYYDQNNRLIRRVTNSSFERIYSYDTEGNLIEVKTMDENILIASVNRTFNKKNLKKKEEIIRYTPMTFPIKIEKNSKSVTRYRYKNGLLVCKKTKINKIKTKDFFYYSSNGKLIKKAELVFLLGIPMKTAVRLYKYDTNGNLTKEVFSEKENEGFYSKTTYSFNDSSLLISESFFMSSSSSPVSTDSLSYNAQGLLSVRDKYSYGKYSNSTTYEYDNEGNLITETYKTSSGLSKTIKYKYDNYRNRIVKEHYENGELKSVIKRQIEYN